MEVVICPFGDDRCIMISFSYSPLISFSHVRGPAPWVEVEPTQYQISSPCEFVDPARWIPVNVRE